MIGSPLNYTGNKFKLLPQLIPYLNNQSDTFVDIFAGSGVVALNTNTKEIVLNDNNKITIELLEYFKNNDSKDIDETMDKIIKEYGFTDSYRNGLKSYKEEKHEGLSKYNKAAFNKLKKSNYIILIKSSFLFLEGMFWPSKRYPRMIEPTTCILNHLIDLLID